MFPKPKKKEKQKRNREYNDDYMIWVLGWKCCVPSCGSYPVQAHHALHKSQLGSDKSCVPLCYNCHVKYHKKHGSVESFEKEFGVNLLEVSKNMNALYEAKVKGPYHHVAIGNRNIK